MTTDCVLFSSEGLFRAHHEIGQIEILLFIRDPILIARRLRP